MILPLTLSLPLLSPPLVGEPPVGIGRDQAQREAAAELLKSEYPHESLLERILRAIQDFIDRIFGGGSGAGGSLWSLIAIVVVLVLLAALLAWALRRTTRGRHPEGAVFGVQERTAAEHRALAARLAAEGDWTGAIQERLRAIARGLEERAIVSPLPGRTAMELADTAGEALPAHAQELRSAARVFDDVTYGEVAGTSEAYTSLVGLDERIMATRVALESTQEVSA
ncbi:hypothetical protein Pth03_17080 [Planotetraspora thailandica]|uniref:Protein-glutamine gamma-glutamyltransferase-like C-terminal domain-containing protein n=1 Tax=Planotetraspora thailandica TaxID=487172 RepID=A0A8J3UWH2_9ACTN|nr:DUF4129 domain-containing protein [Planotetraspora thailandica]GII53319.1 hypothetical protein Pth03_17080 [Planotetraspora thailandica]